jgi:hypothetical protein
VQLVGNEFVYMFVILFCVIFCWTVFHSELSYLCAGTSVSTG